jgi:MFS family permease
MLAHSTGDDMNLSKENAYYGIISFMGISINATGAYYVLFLRDIGLSFSQIAVLNTVYMIMHILIEYPSGVMADKYGRKLTFLLGITLHAAYYTGVGLSRTFVPIAAAYAVGGAGMAFISGTLTAWMVDEVTKEKGSDHIKFVFGKSPIFTGIAGAVSGVIASLVVGYGLNVPFLAAGGFGFLAAILAIVLMNENYGSVHKAYNVIFISGIKQFFSNPYLLLLTVLSILFHFCIGIFMLTWQVVLTDQGVPNQLVGFMFVGMFLAMSAGGVIASRLFKRIDKISVLKVAALGSIVCYLGIGVFNYWWVSLICFIGIEIIMALWGAALSTWLNEHIPSETRATLLSAYSTIFAVFYAMYQPVIGKIIDSVGKQSYFIGVAILFICLLIILVRGGESSEESGGGSA